MNNKREEPVPLFQVGEEAFYGRNAVTILSVSTYCKCCDTFLDEAKYGVLAMDKTINHRVRERDLKLPSEVSISSEYDPDYD